MVAHIRIPLGAFTAREVMIRYGLFFLFVLAASPPALFASVSAWRGIAGIAMRIAGKEPWSAVPLTHGRRTFLRFWRGGICLCMIGFARIV
jgi:hypothetical protein